MEFLRICPNPVEEIGSKNHDKTKNSVFNFSGRYPFYLSDAVFQTS